MRDSGERVVSADSVATCSAAWFCYPYSTALAHCPIVNKSPHPIWSDLYCKSVGIKRHGEGAIITAQYEGSEFVWYSDKDSSENTVEVSCTMREEPIESHPDFERWAGSPDKPNCGIFDDDGKFVGWNSKTQGGKIMAGVKSYLVPSYSAAVGYIQGECRASAESAQSAAAADCPQSAETASGCAREFPTTKWRTANTKCPSPIF